jgi:hypothetical protein
MTARSRMKISLFCHNVLGVMRRGGRGWSVVLGVWLRLLLKLVLAYSHKIALEVTTLLNKPFQHVFALLLSNRNSSRIFDSTNNIVANVRPT